MSIDENKAQVRRLYAALNAAWPAGNWDALDAFIAPDYVYHEPSDPIRGREGFRQLLDAYRSGFPDTRFTIEQQVAEGDSVLSRLTGTGTHRGDFMGITPTGSPVTVSILNLMRLHGGMVVEEWERFDTAYLLQQIGALPAPAEAAG